MKPCAPKQSSFARAWPREKASKIYCPKPLRLCAKPPSAPSVLRHYDVQMIGGIVLHSSKIAEMRTGEGKTLVSTLPIYLNALEDKGVHLITVNDYLARRDARWMGLIYDFPRHESRRIANGGCHREW
jgi:hypothetical protein